MCVHLSLSLSLIFHHCVPLSVYRFLLLPLSLCLSLSLSLSIHTHTYTHTFQCLHLSSSLLFSHHMAYRLYKREYKDREPITVAENGKLSDLRKAAAKHVCMTHALMYQNHKLIKRIIHTSVLTIRHS